MWSGGANLFRNSAEQLVIYDLKDPAAPAEISKTLVNRNAVLSGLELSGNTAFILTVNNKFYIFDITNLAAPAQLAYMDLTKDGQFAGGLRVDVAVSGNTAYLAAGKAGLRIVDVSNLSAPVQTKRLQVCATASDVEVIGKYVYVMCIDEGIKYFDPAASPPVIRSWDIAGRCPKVTPTSACRFYGIRHDSANNRLYAAVGDLGLYVLDISKPEAPALLGSINTPNVARDVAFQDKLVFLSDGFPNAVRAIDATQPAAMKEVGSLSLGGFSDRIALYGQYLYVAGTNPLEIIKWQKK